MPVKLGAKLPPENAEARIEIVPLIDIMFFLLAAFMLVSLTMVHANMIKVNLPTATTASPDTMKDSLTVSIDRNGKAFFGKTTDGRQRTPPRTRGKTQHQLGAAHCHQR
jgi:biopolymer transport protein ExbD